MKGKKLDRKKVIKQLEKLRDQVDRVLVEVRSIEDADELRKNLKNNLKLINSKALAVKKSGGIGGFDITDYKKRWMAEKRKKDPLYGQRPEWVKQQREKQAADDRKEQNKYP
jgi:CRISPR/Cas system CSM-associated protein Csm4 (group 5 of RAMP superfamily)